MEKVITMENFRNFAYCNNQICKKPIRGIVVSFFGLGTTVMHNKGTDLGRMYAKEGILYLFPYMNPWAWMNQQTVNFTEELLDVLIEGLGLNEDIPIVSIGGSMGGLSALVYTAYAKRVPIACVTDCPVCDLPYHYTERQDLPRTLYSAFGTYPGTMEEALRTASPIHLVDKMPVSIRYYVFHSEEDALVNKQQHSDRFVEKMKEKHEITYYSVPESGHCAMPEETRAFYHDLIMDLILR